MRKVRFIENYKNYKVGDIVEVGNNIAFGLVDSGKAVLISQWDQYNKMISQQTKDYFVKEVKKKKKKKNKKRKI